MKYFFAGIVVPASALIPVVVAVYRRSQLATRHRILVIYLALTMLVNVICRILAQQGINNIPVLHFYALLEMWLFSGFFYRVIKNNTLKRIIWAIPIVFIILCVINFVFFQSIYTFNTYTRPLGAIVIIFFCMAYWWQPASAEESEVWTAVADNWVVSAILFYFSSALFLFIFSNYLIQQVSKQANVLIWNIHAAIVMLMYLMLAVAFQKSRP